MNHRLISLLCAVSVLGALTPSAPSSAESATPKAWEGRAFVEEALKKHNLTTAYAEYVKVLGEMIAGVKAIIPDEMGPKRVLGVVDRIFADPLCVVDESNRLTEPLEAAGATDDVVRMIDALAPAVDLAALADPDTPKRPAAGAKLDEYVAYFRAVLTLAKARRDEAIEKLDDAAQRLIAGRALAMFGILARTFYLEGARAVDPNGFKELVELVKSVSLVNWKKMWQAGRALAGLSDKAWLTQVRKDLGAAKDDPAQKLAGVTGGIVLTTATPLGPLVIGGKGANTYTGRFALILDLGGNDSYLDGPATVAVPRDFSGNLPSVAVVIDLAGNDSYASQKYIESIGVAQSAAILGTTLLCDLEGDDTYSAGAVSQACAFFGVALLVDFAGHDKFTGGQFSQGVAFGGLGLCYDAQGNDTVTATTNATGLGYPLGVGCYYNRLGNDKVSTSGENASPKIGSTYGAPADAYHGLGQGVGFGLRSYPERNEGYYSGGGVGLCVDSSGDDEYACGEFGMGCGYFLGLGIFKNTTGNDTYKASRYGLGTGAHQAIGVFIDNAGNDKYFDKSVASMAGNWDTTVSVLLDAAGDDSYDAAQGLALGGAAISSFALFYDAAGKDTYKAGGPDALGDGGHNDDTVNQTTCLGIFIDRGKGADTYSRSAAEGQNPRGNALGNVFIKKKGDVVLGYGLFVDESQ